MKIEYIRKELQETNRYVIDAYNYFAHYKYEKNNDYLQKSLDSAIKVKEIITNIIDTMKEIELNIENKEMEEKYE